MARGFAFSIDALLAVLILISAVAAISFFSSSASTDIYSQTIMKKQADDLLNVLNANGELATLNSSLLNSSINSTLIGSTNWNLDIQYYNYSGGFKQAGNITLGGNYSNVKTMVLGTDIFLVFQNKRVKYYGVARLRLWPK